MPSIYTRSTHAELGEFTSRLTCYPFYTEISCKHSEKLTYAISCLYAAKPCDMDILDDCELTKMRAHGLTEMHVCRLTEMHMH
jgi:hypothetical protein